MMIARRSLLFTAAALPVLARPALAQRSFPDRPIRMLIGYPQGGGVDTVGRPVLMRLQEKLGQPLVVDNRAGASGNIAMEHVARADPDGHTLFMGDVGNLAITHALYPNLPFDTQRDFVGVAQVTTGPVVLVVPSSLPVRTLPEFVTMLRSRPGELHFGSAGNGSGPHLFYESWRRAAGVDLVHVPYRGTGPALQGMLSGDTQLMIGNFGVFRGVYEAGQVRILGISSDERHPGLPDVPTVREQGTDWSIMSFNAIVAPSRIPPERRQMLEDGFRAVMADAELGRLLTGMGSVVSFTNGADFDARMRADRATWTKLVHDAKIEVG